VKDLDSRYLRHLSYRTKAQKIMVLVNNGSNCPFWERIRNLFKSRDK